MENLLKTIKDLEDFVESLICVSAPIPSDKVNKYTRALENLKARFEREFMDSCCEDYLNTLFNGQD